ncbi:hypothetical protein EOS93_25285 [Rhizobium sp. RMa-01]|uniref:hypothetical protein n=1 Tax=unclassified Rhizobium TaxID=2613769 RepID=UPI0008DABFE9|nr:MULTISPECIES: hypothetical protein [unclassified Rhizobium]OHV24927.1 hypothetical protein BBJ66_22550 [Rhizobium sp. RSm-3]RVU08365.1 hypothetical protein EOS93_25285 [Rhizobium sp. RMa-01]
MSLHRNINAKHLIQSNATVAAAICGSLRGADGRIYTVYLRPGDKRKLQRFQSVDAFAQAFVEGSLFDPPTYCDPY